MIFFASLISKSIVKSPIRNATTNATREFTLNKTPSIVPNSISARIIVGIPNKKLILKLCSMLNPLDKRVAVFIPLLLIPGIIAKPCAKPNIIHSSCDHCFSSVADSFMCQGEVDTENY